MFMGNNGFHNNTRNEELLLSFRFQPVLSRLYSRYTLSLPENTKYEMYVAELWLKKFLSNAILEKAEENIYSVLFRGGWTALHLFPSDVDRIRHTIYTIKKIYNVFM